MGVENKCIETDTRNVLKYRTEFEAIAAENLNAHIIRTYDLFCRDGRCNMADSGVLHFRDEHHLNMQGSEMAGAMIASKINLIKHNAEKR